MRIIKVATTAPANHESASRQRERVIPGGGNKSNAKDNGRTYTTAFTAVKSIAMETAPAKA